mgnify:CR=1 FL=1
MALNALLFRQLRFPLDSPFFDTLVSRYGSKWFFKQTRFEERFNRSIYRAEREYDVVLTPNARLMLRLPVEESYEQTGEFDPHMVDDSIHKVIEASVESKQGPTKRVDSISVIRGFHKRYCNIPPFCKRVDG